MANALSEVLTLMEFAWHEKIQKKHNSNTKLKISVLPSGKRACRMVIS